MKRRVYFPAVTAAMALPVLAALVGLTCAGSADANPGLRPAEPAGKYMVSIVKQKLGNDYARAWQSLYPAHQRVAALDEYVACESLVPSAGTLIDVRALRTFDEWIWVAGQSRKMRTRAVKVRVSVAAHDFPLFPVVLKPTFHAIAVNGQWTWILSPRPVRLLQRGNLPLCLRSISPKGRELALGHGAGRFLDTGHVNATTTWAERVPLERERTR